MSEDIRISSDVLSTMSIKGRGYLEAAIKRAEALRLLAESDAELAHLDGRKPKSSKGYGGAGGGREVQLPKFKLAASGKRSPSKATVDDLLKLLEKGPLSTTEIAKAAGCSDSHVRVAFRDDRRVGRIGAGNQINWTLTGNGEKSTLRRKSSKTVAHRTASRASGDVDFGDDALHCKMILEAIQADEWMTITRINHEVLTNQPRVVRVLKRLEHAGMISTVKKTGNPALPHNRTGTYYQATPGAKVETTATHAPGCHVDVEAQFDTVTAGIKNANGWANNRVLEAATNLSGEPLRRVLKAMKKQKRIKQVWKKHNPAHKQPKNFEREAQYWEIA
jgi:DNA-binding Lrp family transcriptional regulator